MALLLEPLQFTFMSHALLISLVVSIPCALLSVFLVLKRLGTDGWRDESCVFHGIVLARILGLPLATGHSSPEYSARWRRDTWKTTAESSKIQWWGLFFWHVCRRSDLYIAVKPDVHLDHILFGDMLGITIGDIIQTVIIAGLVTLVISVKWRDFLLFSFDYQQAQASGFAYEMAALWAAVHGLLTIVATLKAVGIILYFSLIAPGAIAVLLTQRFILRSCWRLAYRYWSQWLVSGCPFIDSASSDNCCLIRGHVHHDVYRYQHQRTHKGKCRTTGFVIIRLAEHSASNIRLLAMRLNE